MLYNIWKWIQIWILPIGILSYLYRFNKALPANIKTMRGGNLKAIMVDVNHGLLFREDKYIENRLEYLKQKQAEASILELQLRQEIDDLSYIQKQALDGIQIDNGL